MESNDDVAKCTATRSPKLSAIQGAGRPSLRTQLEGRLYRAQTEAGQAAKLARLLDLLERYPDVAEILDLVEELSFH